MENIFDVENMSEEEAEKTARTLGWRPKEEFNGDGTKFTDAKVFLDKANTNIPMLRENAKKIEQRNRMLEEKLNTVNEQIQALTKRAEEADRLGYERAIRDIEARQRKAVAEGDVDAFDDLQKQKEALNVKTTPQTQTQKPIDINEQIAIQVFESQNPWFKADAELNQDMCGFVLGIKNRNPNMPMADVLEMAKQRTIKANPDKFTEQKANAVLSSGGNGAKMSYASIPAAEKAGFDRELEKNVHDMELRGVAKEKIEQFKKEYQKNCLDLYSK